MIRQNAPAKFMALAGLLAALGLCSLSSAQTTRTIHPSRTFTATSTGITSTYSIQPQIQPDPPFSVPEVAAENDYTPPLPRERSNTLRAGGLMSASRGKIGRFFPGPVDGRYVPPDCNMAVGPTHIVTVINSTIAFFTKTGTKIFQSQLDGNNGFFTGTAQTGFVFDPKCFYDPISNRFFVIALDLDEGSSISNALIAVSDDSDPNGNWFKYRISAVLSNGGNSYWLDYPGYGFNKDAIVVTGNMFGFSNGYFGVQALVIKKAPLLTGGSPQVTSLLDPGVGTLQPTRTTDTSNDKIWGVATGGGNAMRFYAFTNLTSTPLLKEVDVPVPAYNGPPGPAPSGGNQIDTLDGRTMTAHFRAAQVVAAHTIGVNGVNTVRWYDFNVNNWPASGTPTLKQSGNITGTGVSTHMPAININKFEDISVLFTRSSASIAADIMESSRLKTDPAGQMGQPVKLSGSASASYQSFRWGDYFGNEIDPFDDTTFWGFGMAIGANGAYITEIVNWTVTPSGGIAGNPVPADSVSTYSGNYVFGDTTSIATSDDIFYQVGSAPISQFGQSAGVEADFTVPLDTTSISVQYEGIGGVTGGTAMVWLYNWTTSQYDLVGSNPLAASGNTSKVITAKGSMARYIGAGGHVNARVRGHMPIKPLQGGMPNPFTFKIDQLQLFVR